MAQSAQSNISLLPLLLNGSLKKLVKSGNAKKIGPISASSLKPFENGDQLQLNSQKDKM
jgi:hypothetical protein